ncbi:ROK family protein [Microbacterium capsulatum]|uniref:ROK family protein n=1 Tax=Microbacterium capsulatum TaxID=3041921 RepID=A0ABU0XKK6_9MICO|nr:ROK family protein [Microbacterium sp. ASV81]MDQ4215118.1 ROK family protein [Microbacterium sp. ASV81]
MTTAPSSIVARSALQLRDSGPATVTDLTVMLGLSRTSVENAMAALSDAGLIFEVPAASGRGAGRPARRFAFHATAGVVVGVDIGVASVRVLVADLAGAVIAQRTFPGVSAEQDGASKLAAVIADANRTLSAAGIPVSRVKAIGVALPGIVDDLGRVTASVVIPEWSGIDIGSHLRQAFGCPVAVDNGVRLAAVAEHHLGVAQLVDDVLYLSVGNRIAMGLLLGGRPRRGIHNAAGDIGRHAFRGLGSETGQIRWRTGETAAEVFERARGGDAEAIDELDRFVTELAHGIATLVMTVDPAMIVIGGGLSAAHGQLLDPLRERLAEHIALPFTVPIAEARMGAEAAAHGALVHAFRRHASAVYGIEGLPVPSITPLPHDGPGLPADPLLLEERQ